ncbi:MAG: DUF4169 family protein [Pseudomonadota bacterium]
MAEFTARRLSLVEPINLNKVRKAKARADKEQRAQENRIKHGRTKAEKARDKLQAEQRKNAVDHTKRED